MPTMQGEIALTMICQGERYREVDELKAQELATSMAHQGLLQPIGVRPCRCEAHEGPRHFRLVFGAHRLRAAAVLEWESIPARMFPDDMPEELAQLAELQENAVRHELTGSQRKQYAAEVGRLLDKLTQLGHLDIVQKEWIGELSRRLGVDRRTVVRWWEAFCQDIALDKTPSKATAKDQQAFYDWLDAQHRQAAAEKQRREDEAHAQRQHDDLTEARGYLDQLAADYGIETVWHEVLQVWCTQRGIAMPALPEDGAR